MKTIKITPARLRFEGTLLAVCFVAAFGLNIYSIARFDTEWMELLTQLHIVLAITFFFYILLAVFRFIVSKVFKLLKRHIV